MIPLIKDIKTLRYGDIGMDDKGDTYVFGTRGWSLIGITVNCTRDEAEMIKRKRLYESGERNYTTEEGLTMTIRPDGTEYIDKKDMPVWLRIW